MCSIQITDHAFQRGKERFSLKNHSLIDLAQKAYDQGYTHSEVPPKIKRYFDKLYLEHKKANNMRIYGHYVLLFRDKALITLFSLPLELRKIIDKHARKEKQ